MLDRDYRDLCAGLGLTLFGLAATMYALAHYATGSVTRMGPGMMPAALGVILAVFGLLVAIPALWRKGARLEVRFRVLIILSVSIVTFAMLIETMGLVPAVFATTVIATFAERKVPVTRAMALGAAMSLLTWGIFVAGLRLALDAFAWPF